VFSERSLAVIARRLSPIVLAVVASLAWTGCQPAVLPPVESQKGRPLAQKKATRKFVQMKADEDLIRVRLLTADAVQKDLGLTADQKGKTIDFVKVGRERSREYVAKWPEFAVSGVPVMASEGRTHEFEAWLKVWQSRQKEMRATIVGMLTPNQRERLKQIQLQQTIAAALTKPEFIRALEISEEQLARIRPDDARTYEEQETQVNALDGWSPKERRKKYIELAKQWDQMQSEANKLAMRVLTPEQRVKLEKFLGKEIAVTWDYDELIPDDGFIP
jgi:hypothetical protein